MAVKLTVKSKFPVLDIIDEMDPRKTLKTVVTRLGRDIRLNIVRGVKPSGGAQQQNKPATEARKKNRRGKVSEKPLVDQGRLLEKSSYRLTASKKSGQLILKDGAIYGRSSDGRTLVEWLDDHGYDFFDVPDVFGKVMEKIVNEMIERAIRRLVLKSIRIK